MHEINILYELFIIFSCATVVVLIFHRLKVPHIVGFLVCGIAVGPFGLDVITQHDDINVLAEIGVALLLFTIGMEFSLSELRRIKRDVLLGGALQVVVTGLAAAGIAIGFGLPLPQAIFLSMLFALSSTAIVLSVLATKGEIDTPRGRLILGILLFQDLCIVPMVLITPLLGASGGIELLPLLWSLAKALGLVAGVLLLSLFLVPRLLEMVVRVRLREIMVLGVVVIAIGIAWTTSLFGVSLALGAFIAGLAISESPYSHQVTAEILPFKDIFNSLFFVTIGMLLDLRFLLQNIWIVGILVLATLILKALIAGVTTRIHSGSFKLAIAVGFGIAQIGEFSFVLAKLGQGHALISAPQYQAFLAVAVLTMLVTPFMMQAGNALSKKAPESLPSKIQKQQRETQSQRDKLTNHTVIVGFGLNGRYLARVLKESHIPYVILELNPQTVREAVQNGEPIYFGDASRQEILEHASLRTARALVSTFADASVARKILAAARQLCPNLFIILRTKFAASSEQLYDLGADLVIAEEFETATEIFARVLAEYGLPRSVIQAYTDAIRREGTPLLQQTALSSNSLEKLGELLAGSIVENFLVLESMPVVGQSLVQLDLRKRTGATVIAIVRDSQPISNPGGEIELTAGDLLVVMGAHRSLDAVQKLLAGGIANG
ncbi:MAG: cation:proton antiporter [Deferribacteres bacterium]|nr:cation:proton antiporter [candidate division KSB1 bacterium]MCB9511291.1 cation:proton antiporter [Deferribacteres bacterium]